MSGKLIPFPADRATHKGQFQLNTTIIEVDFKKKTVTSIREIDNLNDVEVQHTHRHEAVRELNHDLKLRRA